jgi:hypothetical protein
MDPRRNLPPWDVPRVSLQVQYSHVSASDVYAGALLYVAEGCVRDGHACGAVRFGITESHYTCCSCESMTAWRAQQAELMTTSKTAASAATYHATHAETDCARHGGDSSSAGHGSRSIHQRDHAELVHFP